MRLRERLLQLAGVVMTVLFVACIVPLGMLCPARLIELWRN